LIAEEWICGCIDTRVEGGIGWNNNFKHEVCDLQRMWEGIAEDVGR
jgi:hypothetical protein